MLVELALELPGRSESVNGSDTRDDFLGDSTGLTRVFESLAQPFAHEHLHGDTAHHDKGQDTRADEGESPTSRNGQDETGEEGREEGDRDGDALRGTFLDQKTVTLDACRDFSSSKVVKVGNLNSARGSHEA